MGKKPTKKRKSSRKKSTPRKAKVLSRADILAAKDLPRRKVKVPEWGGSLWVGTLTGTELDQLQQEQTSRRAAQDAGTIFTDAAARPLWAFFCLQDEDGKRLFTELADIVRLGDKSAVALDRVVDAALDLNVFGGQLLGSVEGN